MARNYESLEQRVIASRYEVFPSFYAKKDSKCSADEQKCFYDFIKGIYTTLYNNPSLLYPTLNEDYGFRNPFTVVGSNHEDTMNVLRKEMRIFLTFIDFLWSIGLSKRNEDGEFLFEGKISNRYSTILRNNGVEIDKNIIKGPSALLNSWHWFSHQEGLTQIEFGRCIFDRNHDYLTDVLVPNIEGEKDCLKSLLDYLNSNNYKKVYTLTKYDKDDSYMVSYVKNIDKKEALVGFPYMGDSSHIGVSFEYRYFAANPYFLTIRIQKMKDILSNFDKLNPIIAQFILNNNKRCDGCRYCVQTDKTKTRPLSNVKVNKEVLCPYYPGFSYSFRDVDSKQVKEILAFVAYLNETLIKD